MAAISIQCTSHKSLNLKVIYLPHQPFPETALQLRRRIVTRTIGKNLRENIRPISKGCLMQLYEIYQNIVLGTSITCIIGLAVAWLFVLSDRNK